MNALFQNVIHATGIHTVRRGDVMLELPLPMGDPNIHRVVKREAIGLLLFGGVFVIQVPTFLFESKAGNIDSTSTVRDSPQGLIRDAPQCSQALRWKWKPEPPQLWLFPLWRFEFATSQYTPEW